MLIPVRKYNPRAKSQPAAFRPGLALYLEIKRRLIARRSTYFTVNSMRRFLRRPSALSLAATGLVSP
jgi:hypothetical protein